MSYQRHDNQSMTSAQRKPIPAPSDLRSGLLVLHGNRLERLAETVFGWLAMNPLGPLEEETFLVQSHGMGEWLKIELATAQGVCAATRVELPARFVWRACRAVLGRSAVPPVSALDKLPLTWRLMGLLPQCADRPGFEPVAGWLGDVAASRSSLSDAAVRLSDGDSSTRRWQLAQRLADLFDQFQVYRGDWLADWAAGDDLLRAEPGQGSAAAPVVPDAQRWQPALWRALLATLTDAERAATRPALHRRFLDALAAPGPWPQLPRRIVLFGSTHIPLQTLEALAALSTHCQVLMAVPNPCRFQWADIIDGRDLLRAPRRRQLPRGGRDLAMVPLQDLHLHGHPLLAAWGRQARDFVRQLDAFDDAVRATERFDLPRIDLFDDGVGATLLEQVQARIRDGVPLAEHAGHAGYAGQGDHADDADPADHAEQAERGDQANRASLGMALPPADRSIVFHVAHGAQREVEILHDQLLRLFADAPDGRPLNPRDVVVMVPDIDAFAPAIRSVFGQHGRDDPRRIPWGIADQRGRGHHPLPLALEWLLHAPQPRCSFSELRDLLAVPAVGRRFGIEPADLLTVLGWAEGAGIRWGLDAAHRESLDLGACGDANSWSAGLRRMLLGYATGDLDAGFGGIEPYGEVAGLSAGLAGGLAELLAALDTWWSDAAQPRSPAGWGERLRALLGTIFESTDDAERAWLAALDDALTTWLQVCEAAAFSAPVDLAVVRSAWLDGLDEPAAARRFRAGGVTFCTLLPMRAIPFEVVCLLGMNDGDYPRRSTRSDFDLMALPGQARPGDRSRHDDDRQLMLDALLSARRVLYVSWAGRSQRDHQQQPPSVLVSQLRDYLQAGWGAGVLRSCTTDHPLQPFSRAYFEPPAALVERPLAVAETPPNGAAVMSPIAGAAASSRPLPLFTYAREWRAAHAEVLLQPVAQAPAPLASLPVATDGPLSGDAHAATAPLTIDRLAAFLVNPVKAFFRHRLRVGFGRDQPGSGDDEPFAVAGLDRWRLLADALDGLQRDLYMESPRTAPEALAGSKAPESPEALQSIRARVAAEVAHSKRAGQLPMAGPGNRVQAALVATLVPMVVQWQVLLAQRPRPRDKLALRLPHPEIAGLVFDDWLVGLRGGVDDTVPAVWLALTAGKIADGKGRAPRADKLLPAWVRSLASAACGNPAGGVVIGTDAVVHVAPLEARSAAETLHDLVRACHEGLSGTQPWPTAVRTGLAWLEAPGDPGIARLVFEGSDHGASGEGTEACLARLYPDARSLFDAPDFAVATRRLYTPYAEWLAAHVTVEPLPNHAVETEREDA